MSKANFLLVIITSLTLNSFAFSTPKNTNQLFKEVGDEKSTYQEAGIIKVKDPKAVMVGYRKPGDDVFEISLDDVGKYTGHVCGGVASGYLLTKKSLELLYPGDEVPVRGEISLTVSSINDITEVAAYVVRAREGEGEEAENNSIVVDSTLRTENGIVTILFKRNDNGKIVKAVFNKSKMMRADFRKKMMPIKKKILDKTATEEDQLQFANNVQEVVKNLITTEPEGLIIVSELKY